MIIWTRSTEDWAEDSRRFPRSTVVRHVPTIRTEVCPLIVWPDTKSGPTTIITSKGSLQIAIRSERGKMLLRSSRSILTFGTKTAALARKLGVPVNCPKGISSAEELALWLEQHLHHHDEIVVLGPEKPAFPIATYLSERGARAKYVALYRTVQVDVKPPSDWADTEQQKYVCFASPSAVESFYDGVKELPANSFARLIPVAIGKTTAKRARERFGSSLQSPRATAESLAAYAVDVAELRDAGIEKVVFFDGVCNLCNRLLNWALLQKPSAAVRFAPLQGPHAKRLLPENLYFPPTSMVSVNLLTGDTRTRTAAVRELTKSLDSVTAKVVRTVLALPTSILDPMYRVVTKLRYFIFGKRQQCRVPLDAERAYLID
jgi:uroporphyrinogen-III synthase/predicted DCC family thiol-disulfide oxidoreductase YuxK